MITDPLPSITVKRGDTLQMGCTLVDQATDGTQTPVDLTGWQIEAQVRDAQGQLVAELNIVERADVSGQYRITGSATDWPVARLLMDIQYTAPGGAVTSTDTVEVRVMKDVTL